MKNKIIFLLFIFIILTGCSNKLSEDEIKNRLEVNNKDRTFTVNKITYASDEITIKEVNIQIKNDTITIGDYKDNFSSQKNKQITGYYDQSGTKYFIFRLTEDKNGEATIWKTEIYDINSPNNIKWVKTNITNASDLVLIDCVETDVLIGQTPTRYKVYAVVNDELVLAN